MLYVLSNRRASVTVDDFGAQLTSVCVGGKERLWQNEDGTWEGHAPLLFPVCGHFDCIVGGKEYPMPPHGFAKDIAFSLEKQTKSRLTFSISSSEETKQYYPYDFLYKITYRLRGKKLTVEHEVTNLSADPLYFACGGHESFLLENSLSDYKLVFPVSETFVHRPHTEEGYLTGARETLGVGTQLILPETHLRNDFTVILENVRSRRVRLCKNGGEPLADITFKGFKNLLLWRPKNALMICIEPWTNLPDDETPIKRDFSEKNGLLRVEGKVKKRLKRTIKYY